MAKGKYYTHVEPRLDEIKGWARDGHTDKEIYTALGVGHDSFCRYKKEYPELSEALIVNKAIADRKVEESLYLRSIGMKIKETKTTTKKVRGQVAEVLTTVTEKELAPDIRAMEVWLKNRKPEQWRGDHTAIGDVTLEDIAKAIIGSDTE